MKIQIESTTKVERFGSDPVNPQRQFLLDMEDFARRDPDRAEKPVIAMRRADINEAAQVEVWGPDWRDEMHETTCSFCAAIVIVRPVFADSKTVVCRQCAPKLIDALEGKGQA